MGYVYKRCKVQDNTTTIEDEMSEERVYKTKIGAIPKTVSYTHLTLPTTPYV